MDVYLHALPVYYSLTQGFTYKGHQVACATKFCSVTLNICGPSEWNLVRFTILAPNFCQVAVRFLEKKKKKLDLYSEECIIPCCVVRTFGSFFESTINKFKLLWKTEPKIMK